MAELVTANQYQLGPDTSRFADRVSGIIQRKQDIQREDQLREEAAQIEQARVKMLGVNTQLLALRDVDFETQNQQLNILAQQAIAEGADPKIYEDIYAEKDPITRNTLIMHQALKSEKIAQAVLDQQSQAGKGAHASAKTEIFDDGSALIIRSDGTRQVLNAAGVPVAGEEAATIIKNAQEAKMKRAEERARLSQETATHSTNEAIREAQAKGRQEASQAARTKAGEQARIANRTRPTLRTLSQLAEKVDAGAFGEAKVLAARLFPDIDVQNEAVLSSALTEMALAQLASFKGPTTDFEYRIAQSVTGTLSDGRSALSAKIAAAQRGAWFNEKYSSDLNKYLDNGGDPAAFRFDYEQMVETPVGPRKLQDIWDTAVRHHITMEGVLERLK